MTDRRTSSSAYDPKTGHRGRASGDKQKRDMQDVLDAFQYLMATALVDPQFLESFSEIVAPRISVTQHYIPSSFVSQLRYRSTPLRNMLAHRSTPLTDGLVYDQLRLFDDQQELSDDFTIAVLRVLAEKRPDIFLEVVRESLQREHDPRRKTRTFRLIFEVLSDKELLEKVSRQAVESNKSQQTLEGGGDADSPAKPR